VAHWDVLRSLSANLHSLRAAFAPGDLPAYRAFISRNFLGRWKAVGMYARLGEKPADTLAREYLATLLVSEARDPGVIAQLSLATPGPPPRMTDLPQVLAPELRAEALRATLIADPAYADRLVADFLSTNEEGYRRDIVYGFAGSEDPRTIGKLLALAATRIRTGELRYLSAYMADEPVARQTLWAFVGAHYDDFAKRLTQQGMGRMTDILQNACDAKDKADAEAFFQARMGGAPAAARRLAHTEERIDRCIALRKAKGPEISAALAAAH